jgi:hypothetical protein
MEATMETTTDPRMAMYSPDQIAKIEAADEQVRKKMSRRGELGLPPLLDQRRLEFGITDGAFDVQASFDHILVFQLPEKSVENGTYGDTSIIVPENAKDNRKKSAPRGVIVSAGLKALDELRSNGMELGDIAMFNQISPWRIETDLIGGRWHYLLVLHTGHIIGSEDTTKRLRSGELKLSRHGQHVYSRLAPDGLYEDADEPVNPEMSEES